MKAVGARLRRGVSPLVMAAVLASLLVPAMIVAVKPAAVLASNYSSTILGDSPKVYYRLDETGCCTASDSSGNGYSGTYASSGITYAAAGALTGDSDAAITTSSSSAAVSRHDSFLPSGAAARTVEV